MILLKKSHYHQMIEYSIAGLPNEACGLIGGTIENDKKIVQKVYTMINVDGSREHFSMAPKEQFAVVKDMRTEGIVMLGNFHSHPESPSRPSEEDKRLAYDPQASYLILSLMDCNKPILKSFKIVNGIVSEELIEIMED